MRNIRRMKGLNSFITGICFALGISITVLAILQVSLVYETTWNTYVLIATGIGLLVFAWIQYVVYAFVIEWAENTYLLRLSYEDLRSIISSPSRTQTVAWHADPATKIDMASKIDPATKIDMASKTDPASMIDMASNRIQRESRVSARHSWSNDPKDDNLSEIDNIIDQVNNQIKASVSIKKLPFELALMKLSEGLAIENEVYKLQKYRDGKIIIGYRNSESRFQFDYLTYSKVIPQLHHMSWVVADKDIDIVWK
jgi:hypothetical protein